VYNIEERENISREGVDGICIVEDNEYKSIIYS